jgi:hypothetical protein
MTKPFIRVFEYFSIIFLLLLTLLTISGVGLLESLRFAFVSGLICISGGQLWKIISKNYDLSAFEFLGMGLAFGSAASSGLQICLRTTPLGGIAWALMCVFIPIGLKVESNQSISKSKAPSRQSKSLTPVITYLDLVAVVAFALAWHWWWIYPFAIATVVSSFTLRMHIRKNTTTTFGASILGLSVLVPIYIWCTTLRVRHDLWKVISHDQVFSESLSWSLNSFGRGDSPFLSGFKFSYHWLALHWAGLLTQASNGGSWISVTQVIPILSYLGIFCLLVSLSSKIRKGAINITFTAIPFLFLSNTFGFNLERYIVSPTFQFTCIWMLATINILFALFEHFSWTKLSLTGLMLFATLGGKLMNGIVIVGGLAIVALLPRKHSGAKNHNVFKFTLLVSLISAACAYLYFFQTNRMTNANSLKFALQIGSDVGIVRPESTIIVQVLGALIFNLAMSIPVVVAVIFTVKMRKQNSSKLDLLSASMTVGILATTLTTHEGASQLYFLLAALVISLVIYPEIAARITIGTSMYWKMILCSAACGVISQLIWNHSKDLSEYRSSVYFKLLAVSICPFVALGIHLWQKFKSSNEKTVTGNFAQVLFSVILVSSVSIGLFQRVEKLPVASRSVPVNPTDPSLITGSVNHLEVLNWVRTSTNADDIIAINRFCIPGVDYCIMKWQLVSAIGHRRMLLEGGYGSPGTLQAGEIQDRFDISSQFANSPDEISLKHLCDKGVTWFFYDFFGITPRVDWYPYATVKMSNQSVSLLELNCSSNQS